MLSFGTCRGVSDGGMWQPREFNEDNHEVVSVALRRSQSLEITTDATAVHSRG